eukprot:GHRR01012061.1.p4 GENE.GHRR01012061.1~~GHRR01012061.1.p4  ORF type:complete len:124 (+),score=39.00 GHRR01012061.1:1127-1498(+)
MTAHLLEQYFADRSFYQLQAGALVDNPDQRIAADVRCATMTKAQPTAALHDADHVQGSGAMSGAVHLPVARLVLVLMGMCCQLQHCCVLQQHANQQQQPLHSYICTLHNRLSCSGVLCTGQFV